MSIALAVTLASCFVLLANLWVACRLTQLHMGREQFWFYRARFARAHMLVARIAASHGYAAAVELETLDETALAGFGEDFKVMETMAHVFQRQPALAAAVASAKRDADIAERALEIALAELKAAQ
jgi:hypothetical protein